MSDSGKHLNVSAVDFKIAPLVEPSTAYKLRSIGIIMMLIVSIAVTITFILALFCRGSLITTWLCINSVQLLAHVPMIAIKLPANSHYFLLNFLSVLRLNFKSFNDSVDDLGSRLEEYQLISNDNTFYSAHLHNMGYRYSFAHNTLLIACAALVLAFVWLFVTVTERLMRLCRLSRAAGRSSAEASMSNCMVRFLMEAHFELMICAFITLSNVDKAGSIYWLLSLAYLILSFTAIISLASRLYTPIWNKFKQGSRFIAFDLRFCRGRGGLNHPRDYYNPTHATDSSPIPAEIATDNTKTV